jgi:hypothetical protein
VAEHRLLLMWMSKTTWWGDHLFEGRWVLSADMGRATYFGGWAQAAPAWLGLLKGGDP